MRPERWRQIDDILQAAFERAPGDRAAFLDHACAGDSDLRREVEALLASDQRANSFIEAPAVQMAAPLLVEHAGGSLVGQSIGHYQVISLLGKGGMGEVYLGAGRSAGSSGRAQVPAVEPGLRSGAAAAFRARGQGRLGPQLSERRHDL